MLVQAVEAVRASGDTLALGRALTMQSRYLWFHGDTEGSRAPLSEAITVLETLPVSHELADAYAEIAGRDLMAGRMLSGRDLADKALELADAVGAKDVYARALQFRVRSGSPSTATTSAAWGTCARPSSSRSRPVSSG